MSASRTAEWFFDFVSPFAYLQLEQFDSLPPTLEVVPRPVVLGAILSHLGQRGPAEIEAKRVFTYRHVLFRAQALGIALRMPPAHPFNPIGPLRLAVALGGSLEVVRRIFRHIWRDGNDVASPEGFAALCEALDYGAGAAGIQAQPVKDALRRHTDRAIELGVFGVPTFNLDGELFWGEDATGLFRHCLESPGWLEDAEVRRVSRLPVGVRRA